MLRYWMGWGEVGIIPSLSLATLHDLGSMLNLLRYLIFCYATWFLLLLIHLSFLVVFFQTCVCVSFSDFYPVVWTTKTGQTVVWIKIWFGTCMPLFGAITCQSMLIWSVNSLLCVENETARGRRKRCEIIKCWKLQKRNALSEEMTAGWIPTRDLVFGGLPGCITNQLRPHWRVALGRFCRVIYCAVQQWQYRFFLVS